MSEKIHHLKEGEVLHLSRLGQYEADAIYALIMWLEGFQEGKGRLPGSFELLMAYRSAKAEKKS